MKKNYIPGKLYKIHLVSNLVPSFYHESKTGLTIVNRFIYDWFDGDQFINFDKFIRNGRDTAGPTGPTLFIRKPIIAMCVHSVIIKFSKGMVEYPIFFYKEHIVFPNIPTSDLNDSIELIS